MWNFAPTGQNYARSRGASFVKKALAFLTVLDGSEALFEIGDNIVDVLRADGKADGRGRDALIEELFLGQLRVRRGRRMDDQGPARP